MCAVMVIVAVGVTHAPPTCASIIVAHTYLTQLASVLCMVQACASGCKWMQVDVSTDNAQPAATTYCRCAIAHSCPPRLPTLHFMPEICQCRSLLQGPCSAHGPSAEPIARAGTIAACSLPLMPRPDLVVLELALAAPYPQGHATDKRNASGTGSWNCAPFQWHGSHYCN